MIVKIYGQRRILPKRNRTESNEIVFAMCGITYRASNEKWSRLIIFRDSIVCEYCYLELLSK